MEQGTIMPQKKPVIYSLNGASLVEYEAGKFKITKEKPFLDLPDTNLGEIDNPDYGITENKNTTIGELVWAIYNELDSRHELGSKYNRGFDQAESCDLYDILLEVIPNAELHGNKYDLDKATYIEYTFNEDETTGKAVFTMTVRDEGEGFNYKSLRAAEVAAKGIHSYNNYRQITGEYDSGRGLFKTLRYCDTVSWNGKGNEITFTKTLTRTI